MFLTSPKAAGQHERHPMDRCDCDRRWDYKVRVRGTTYLWGSAGVTANLAFPSPLLLHIRNDPFGQPITIGTEQVGGPQTTIATLQAGELVSIPIQQLSAVSATCTYESTATCWLRK